MYSIETPTNPAGSGWVSVVPRTETVTSGVRGGGGMSASARACRCWVSVTASTTAPSATTSSHSVARRLTGDRFAALGSSCPAMASVSVGEPA